MPNYIFLNGKFLPASSAKIGISDRGLLYGDGIFETMRSYSGTIFKLDEHLDRLITSAKTLKITVPSRSSLKNSLYNILTKNKLKDAYLRLTVTRGAGGTRLAVDQPLTPTIIITAKSFEPYPAIKYKKGFKVKILSVRRNSSSPLSRIKSLNYLDNILGKMEANAGHADEGLFLNEKGYIACGTVSNIFFIKGNTLHTPPLDAGILPGITRAMVIRTVAPALGLKVRERNVKVSELKEFDGAFLTNTLMEIMPITRIDHVAFTIGKTVRMLMDHF